jgi:hypothetical protein
MATAQNVVSDMSGGNPAGPNISTLQGATNRYQAIEKKQETDPALKGAENEFETSSAEAKQTISDVQQKLKGVDHDAMLKPWDAQAEGAKYTTPMMQQFGSVASAFALIASAFTHQPLINGLNGAAEAMKAIQKGDSDAYNRAYDAFKENSDLAIKRHEMEMQDWKVAADLAIEKPALAEATYKMLSAKYGDEKAAALSEAGLIKDREQLAISRSELGLKYKELQTKMVPFDIFHQSIKEFEQQNKRKPNAQETAGLWGQANMSAQLSSMTPEDRQSMGAMAASGMPLSQVVPGWGGAAIQQRQQARHDAIELIRKQTPGMSATEAGQELANRTVEYQSGKRSVGQLFTMLGATRQAVSQLDYNIEQTKEDMKKLPSSDISPIINAIARGEQKWTGNPAYSSLFYHMAATATESARILSGGQASVAQLHAGAQAEAQQWANVNMTRSSFLDPKNGVAKAMTEEGHFRLKTFEDAIGYQLKSTTSGGMSGGNQAQEQYTVGQVLTGSDGKQYRVKSIDPNDPSDPDVEPVQ